MTDQAKEFVDVMAAWRHEYGFYTSTDQVADAITDLIKIIKSRGIETHGGREFLEQVASHLRIYDPIESKVD
jgi:hypothetical protein